MYVNERDSFTVIIGGKSLNEKFLLYAHARISFTLRVFALNLAIYVSTSLHLVHCLKHGGWTVCCHLWLLRAWDLPSCIYEIPEIYITKKLQKLQAVERQAVLQGTDLRWNRA